MLTLWLALTGRCPCQAKEGVHFVPQLITKTQNTICRRQACVPDSSGPPSPWFSIPSPFASLPRVSAAFSSVPGAMESFTGCGGVERTD